MAKLERGDVKLMISRTQIDQVLKVYKTEKTFKVVSGEKGLSRSRQDGIRLSFTGQDVERIKELVNKQPDIRQDRVDPLLKEVEKGEYSVDPKSIADKLVGRLLVDKIR
ncbi:MAG TPA: flagellar biosynthesis anti-sigma factor FlgM [Firmicutes bacterium]|nr:flagellar biosynthesis anti-sigma factor FlgM [Bacillota bacterium]